MGKIAHLKTTCPICGKYTSIYVEESQATSAQVRCEHCHSGFTFGAGMIYEPIGYVASIPGGLGGLSKVGGQNNAGGAKVWQADAYATQQNSYTSGSNAVAESTVSLPENPMRAIVAGVCLLVGWIILLLLVLFGRKLALRVSNEPFTLLSAAVLGTAAYLMSVRNAKWKIAGGCFGVVAALLLGFSTRMVSIYQGVIAGKSFVLYGLWSDNFLYILRNIFPAVLTGLGCSLLLSVLRRTTGRNLTRLCGFATGVLYLCIRLLFLLPSIRYNLSMLSGNAIYGQQLIVMMLPVISAAIAVYLVCMAVYALCHMPQTDVRLHGIGFVWCIIALLGAVFGTASNVLVGTRIIRVEMGAYGFSILQGVSTLTGYALLLSKKRIGLYLILLGTGLMLGAQAAIGLSTFGYQYGGWSLLITMLLGVLNPLFAYLSVRAARQQQATNHG